MCKYHGGDPACMASSVMREVSEVGQQIIVDKHNELRRLLAKGEEGRGIGGGQPPAANMREMVWDEELATIAQRWVDQCPKGAHDKDRRTLDGTWAGQNGFGGGSRRLESREKVFPATLIIMKIRWLTTNFNRLNQDLAMQSTLFTKKLLSGVAPTSNHSSI